MPGMLGKHHTTESKLKISLSLKGRKKPLRSKEHSLRISESKKGHIPWNKGKTGIYSKKTLEKISSGCKGRVPWNKGLTKKTNSILKRMSILRQGKSLVNHCKEKHYNWQGGKSFEPYVSEFDERLREKIRVRDDFVCQRCGRDNLKNLMEYDENLSIHHIDYNKANFTEGNLISLCKSCHIKTNYDREKWEIYFKELLVRRSNVAILH